MNKLKLLLLAPLMVGGCAKGQEFQIKEFVYAYMTSEVQEYTHDVYLAHCDNDAYVEVPSDYQKTDIELEKTGKMIYYYIYGVDYKVSNKGWEYCLK